MRNSWNNVLKLIDTTYMNSFNAAHPNENIDIDTIVKEGTAREFPITEVADNTINQAKIRIDEYENKGQGKFYENINMIDQDIHGKATNSRNAIIDLFK